MLGVRSHCQDSYRARRGNGNRRIGTGGASPAAGGRRCHAETPTRSNPSRAVNARSSSTVATAIPPGTTCQDCSTVTPTRIPEVLAGTIACVFRPDHGWYSSERRRDRFLRGARLVEPGGPVRVSFVNLFYPPDVAPSGSFVTSVAEHRAAMGDEVSVICGSGAYLGRAAKRASASGAKTGMPAEGPRVIRVWTPGLGKASTAHRLADYLSFLAGGVMRLVVSPRQDVVGPLTSPRTRWLPPSSIGWCTR